VNDEMNVGLLDHVAIHTPRLQATIRFYEKMLGLCCGPRADFSFHGAWLYGDGRPLVHLVDTSDTTEHRTKGAGALHHVAFLGSGFEVARRRFAQHGVRFDARENAADGVKRIFLRDPNGVLIELNFRASQNGAP